VLSWFEDAPLVDDHRLARSSRAGLDGVSASSWPPASIKRTVAPADTMMFSSPAPALRGPLQVWVRMGVSSVW
jgi:hypothetical protein